MEKLRGIKTLLMGGAGSGKTHSISTFLDAGIQPFVIATDNGYETLGPWRDKIVVKYIAPASQSFSDFETLLKLTHALSFEGVTNMKDSARQQYTQLLQIVSLCANFVDENGTSYGDVSTWNTDRVLVVDNLTGINRVCLSHVVGGKPVKSQPEWQMAMDHELKLVQMWSALMCHFCLIAHLDREKNEVTGGEFVTAAALGRKNAPQMPPDFSDVLVAKRDGNKFHWRADEFSMDLKTRNFALTGEIPPSFAPGISAWKKRGGVIEASPEPKPKKVA